MENQLHIHSIGFSRSRIVIVHSPTPSIAPLRIAGTRWIATSAAAAKALREALRSNPYRQLAKDWNVSISGSTVMALRKSKLEFPDHVSSIDGAAIYAFGTGNRRVVLGVGTGEIDPQLIGQTSFIALDKAAESAMLRYAGALIGGTSRVIDQVENDLGLRIGGATLTRLRAAAV